MKKKASKRRDTVVATRLALKERRTIEKYCSDEDRTLGSMVRTLVREALKARLAKEDAEFDATYRTNREGK